MITKLEDEVNELYDELYDLLENFDGIDKEILEVLIVERMIKGLENKLLETNETVSKIEEYLKTKDSILTKAEKEHFKRGLEALKIDKICKESILSVWLNAYNSYKPMESKDSILHLIHSHKFNNEEINVVSEKIKELGVIEG